MKVLVIIPAYNEEEAIEEVVNKVLAQDVDVVVINDGSKDNTSINARKTKGYVIDLPSNLGIGGAVQTGYIYAAQNNYDIAIQIDGDGQHRPEYIKEMVRLIEEEKYNMVIGSRFVGKTDYEQTFFRMLGIKITSGIIKMITKTRIYDTTSGYRAADKEIIDMFSKQYPYDYAEPDTNMHVLLKGKKVKEIPVEMNKRTTGVSSLSSKTKAIAYMLKVTLSLMLSSFKKN